MTDDPMRTWLTRLSLGAGIAFTASAEYQLARTLGANQVIAAMLPVAIDAYVMAALRWFRAFDIALSLALMGAAQVAAHALDAGVMRVDLPMVVVVSLLVPVAIWRTHALARNTHPSPAPVPAAVAVQRETAPAPAVPETLHPQLPPPAPEPEPRPVPAALPTAVLAAEPRTRTQVRAEYVPDPDPTPVPATDTDAPDELTTAARTYYRELLANGRTPSIRTLRDTYSIGQQRATRIQTELRKGLL